MTVLFGMAYPEESFPGGYKGKETAGISAFFIVFTLIGYYGAHRQRIYFLIPYSIIIFLFLGGNLMMWSIKPEDSVLDPDSDAIKIIGSVFALVMVCALWLAWQERKKNLQLYGTTSVPRSMSNYFVNPNPYFGSSNINQQPMYQSTGQSVPPMYQQQPPMYQNPYQQQQQPQSFQMWDIDSKFNGSPVNLLYQPGSNSYISLERSQQPSLPPQYQQRDQQSSQSSQFDRQQQQMNQFDQRQARMDQQQQQSRMNGSIGQQQQQRGDGQSSSVGPLIMY